MAAIYTSPFFNVTTVKKPLKVTLAKIVTEEVGRDKEEKEVAYFEEVPIGLVLNKAHKEVLIDLAGSNESTDMIGLKMEVYLDPDVQMGGKRVGGVRIRAPKGA